VVSEEKLFQKSDQNGMSTTEPLVLMLEKQQKRNKECMQFFYQVGFILILYGENNGNLKKKIHTR
jgi:hypothetical protein